MVVGLGAGKGTAFLRQRKDKVQRRKCRSAVPKCFGVVYEGYKGRKEMNIHYCDRCKKPIDGYNYKRVHTQKMDGWKCIPVTYELCVGCFADFEEFMNDRNNNAL